MKVSVPSKKRGKFKVVRWTATTDLDNAIRFAYQPVTMADVQRAIERDPMDAAMEAVVDKWRWREAWYLFERWDGGIDNTINEVVAYLEIVEGEK